ncbi:unnamed protein product [Durusdinium trenchii]|uniref:Uncharacterized protein n=1 Tax=Durusdinium trenchii TaxID=1381693 RepID=A0ABP0I728_9DINO
MALATPPLMTLWGSSWPPRICWEQCAMERSALTSISPRTLTRSFWSFLAPSVHNLGGT